MLRKDGICRSCASEASLPCTIFRVKLHEVREWRQRPGLRVANQGQEYCGSWKLLYSYTAELQKFGYADECLCLVFNPPQVKLPVSRRKGQTQAPLRLSLLPVPSGTVGLVLDREPCMTGTAGEPCCGSSSITSTQSCTRELELCGFMVLRH